MEYIFKFIFFFLRFHILNSAYTFFECQLKEGNVQDAFRYGGKHMIIKKKELFGNVVEKKSKLSEDFIYLGT